MSNQQPAQSAPTGSQQSFDEFAFPSDFEDVVDQQTANATTIQKVSTLVIGKPPTRNPFRTVQYSPAYVCRLPMLCQESRRAQKNGRQHLTPIAPGVPTRKFTERQRWNGNQKFRYQAVYEIENDPDRMNVLYEGWSSRAITTERKTALPQLATSKIYEYFQIRNNFLQCLRNNGVIVDQTILDKHRHLTTELIDNPGDLFWSYCDLSYYHTLLQNEQALAPVMYMCLTEPPVPPPKCALTNAIVMTKQVLAYCMDQPANKSYHELAAASGGGLSAGMTAGNSTKVTTPRGPCENGDECKCDELKTLLYAQETTNLVPDDNGRVDMSNFDQSNSRILVECSDTCGCTSSCPRRQLQRGQQKALIVFFEGKDIGMGVRAGVDIEAGQFLCEYTGEMSIVDKEYVPKDSAEAETKERLADEESYDINFTAMSNTLFISARFAGNASRFLNHSCDNNAVFVESHSRVAESEPLIPRVSVYASKNIKKGEKVTISCWNPWEHPEKSDFPCLCGSANCKKYLPVPPE